MDSDSVKENLQQQLDELEILQSMFVNAGEMRIEDPMVIRQVKNYIEGAIDEVPPFIDFSINVFVNEEKFELCVNFSHEYPQILPDIFIRNHSLNRTQHTAINKNCTDFISELENGVPCVFSITSWLQDNAGDYLLVTPHLAPQEDTDCSKLKRFWLYSHHIYNKHKRREILSLAEELNITGFCLPGKPGIICVEGCESDVNQYWQCIRSMTWKKIVCKVTEDCKIRRFENFEEIGFQVNGLRNNHMDMGELLKYLEERQLGFIFKELFGVEGK